MDNEEKNTNADGFSVDEILNGILDDPKAREKAKQARDELTRQGKLMTDGADETSYYINATKKEEQDGEKLTREATFTLKVTTQKTLPAVPEKKALPATAVPTPAEEEEILEENDRAEEETGNEEETTQEEQEELADLEKKEQEEPESVIDDDIDSPEQAEVESAPVQAQEPKLISVVGVRFRRAGRIYYFQTGDLTVRTGVPVIVEAARGREYGVCVNNPMKIDESKFKVRPRKIVRIADEDDIERHETNKQKEREAFKVCQQKIRQHGLDMKLIDAEYTFDNNKILFYFTSEERVDFRDLVKDLASVFHTRIELRQIGVRDETKILGGYGSCGRPLCCHTYLSDFAPVSIKMAKEQNLSLNPAKISGVCGRLMCCLKNEEETYEELNRQLPHIGDEVQATDGLIGDVEKVNILRQKVRIIVEVNDEKELHEYDAKDLTILRRRKRGQAKPKFNRNDDHPVKRVDHTAEHAQQTAKEHDFASADFTASAAPKAQAPAAAPEAPAREQDKKPGGERRKNDNRRRRSGKKNGPQGQNQNGQLQNAGQNQNLQEKPQQGKRRGQNAPAENGGNAQNAGNPNSSRKNGGRSGHGRRGHGRRGGAQQSGAPAGENRRPAEGGTSDHSES